MTSELNTLSAALGGAGAAVGWIDSDGEHMQLLPGDQIDEPIEPATRFHLCSCSKAFTALAAALLVRDGKLAFDDPLVTVVPEFQLDDAWITAHCSFRDALGMRIGLGRGNLADWGFAPDMPRARRLERVRHVARVAPFRGSYTYFNPGYVAVSLAVERIAGMPFEQFVAERIVEPLGLSDTTAERVTVVPDRFSPWLRRGDGLARGDETVGASSLGSARVFMSMRDMLVWLGFWLDLAGAREHALGEDASLRQTLEPHSIDSGSGKPRPWNPQCFAAYCMGWELTRIGPYTMYQHDGAVAGCAAKACFVPECGVAVGVLGADSLDTLALRNAVLGRTLDLEDTDWAAWAGSQRAAEDGAWLRALEGMTSALPGTGRRTDNSEIVGSYGQPLSGRADIVADRAGNLTARFADAPLFDSRLVPDAAGLFRLAPLNERLFDDNESGAAAVFVDGQDGNRRLVVSLLGEFVRIDTS